MLYVYLVFIFAVIYNQVIDYWRGSWFMQTHWHNKYKNIYKNTKNIYSLYTRIMNYLVPGPGIVTGRSPGRGWLIASYFRHPAFLSFNKINLGVYLVLTIYNIQPMLGWGWGIYFSVYKTNNVTHTDFLAPSAVYGKIMVSTTFGKSLGKPIIVISWLTNSFQWLFVFVAPIMDQIYIIQ